MAADLEALVVELALLRGLVLRMAEEQGQRRYLHCSIATATVVVVRALQCAEVMR